MVPYRDVSRTIARTLGPDGRRQQEPTTLFSKQCPGNIVRFETFSGTIGTESRLIGDVGVATHDDVFDVLPCAMYWIICGGDVVADASGG